MAVVGEVLWRSSLVKNLTGNYPDSKVHGAYLGPTGPEIIWKIKYLKFIQITQGLMS